jgi:hypothetical protein
MKNYQKGTAKSHMQAVANIFKSSGEKVIESRYSQLLYVRTVFGVVDTLGNHHIVRKDHNLPFIIWKGIGEPDVELLKSCYLPQLMKNFNMDTAKNIHQEYEILGLSPNTVIHYRIGAQALFLIILLIK